MLSSATVIIKYSTQHPHEWSSISRLQWQSTKLYNALIAIFTVWYTALAPTLEITQNKPYCSVSSKGGVPSMTLMYQYYCVLITSYRCTAKDSDLKGLGVAYHHWEHSEVLVEQIPIMQFWDEWGWLGTLLFVLPFFKTMTILIYVPVAIHKLFHLSWYSYHELAGSLTSSYQWIFKNHLVTWIVHYIQAINTDRDANCILYKFDHRYVCMSLKN